jgi:EAL domain-containing protein (putative c-di-GMP-specific phosphodiesterase class I)/GGDEF domain-containing protein
MLLPETKERELRFKLALRMGLPIFFLTGLLAFIGLSDYFESIPLSFYVSALLILAVMVYFLFFLIHASFEERVTDPVSLTFSREYLLNYLKKEIKKGPYTFLLVSLDNLEDINHRYGTQNGDKVLREFAHWVGRFIQNKGVEKFPIGRFRGGDFIVGIPGHRSEHLSLLELLCLKAEGYSVDDIEIHVSGAVVDTVLSKELDQVIDLLFEQQQERQQNRHDENEEEIDPSELETAVIAAIRQKHFSMMFQEVREGGERVALDTSVKLYGKQNKLIHQNKYMPVINRLGLSRTYDLMLLEYVVQLCREHEGPERFVLTLFPSTLRNFHFYEAVQMLFSENSEAKGRVILMLEEKEYYNHTRRFNELLQSYRRMGIMIALDRLGSYHTTMLYLRELEVDMVRYDMHYSKQIREPKTQALLQGFNLSAHTMGLKTWIRMIEDGEEARIAASLGIDLVQGNYIGTISPLEAHLERNP